MEISVVVSCYNEAARIRFSIETIHFYLRQIFKQFEILAVNDGSSDTTLQELSLIAERFGVKIINHEINEGKGKAVKDGVFQSQGEMILFLDADLSIPIEELGSFYKALTNGPDIAVASRFISGATEPKQRTWYRRFSGKGFQLVRMLILNSREIQDTQCGFKLFKREPAREIFSIMKVNRFAFDAEVLYLAKKLGYRI